MSVTLVQESDDLLVLRVSGQLQLEAMQDVQLRASAILRTAGRMGFLVILEQFEGWKSGKGWADSTFPEENDQYISRFALVGEEQWRDQALMFALAGLRPIEVEYFTAEAQARQWLAQAPA